MHENAQPPSKASASPSTTPSAEDMSRLNDATFEAFEQALEDHPLNANARAQALLKRPRRWA